MADATYGEIIMGTSDVVRRDYEVFSLQPVDLVVNSDQDELDDDLVERLLPVRYRLRSGHFFPARGAHTSF